MIENIMCIVGNSLICLDKYLLRATQLNNMHYPFLIVSYSKGDVYYYLMRYFLLCLSFSFFQIKKVDISMHIFKRKENIKVIINTKRRFVNKCAGLFSWRPPHVKFRNFWSSILWLSASWMIVVIEVGGGSFPDRELTSSG